MTKFEASAWIVPVAVEIEPVKWLADVELVRESLEDEEAKSAWDLVWKGRREVEAADQEGLLSL